MTREHDYSNGDVLHAAMMDIVQEMLSSYASGVTLEQNTSTSVKVAASSGSGQAALSIAGKLRYISTNETLTISGSAGTYNIHAIVDTESPGASGSDPAASRTFSLEQNNGTPTATSRKIGEVDWNGSSITAVRSTVNAINANQIADDLIVSRMIADGAVAPTIVSFTADATLSQMANQFVEIDFATSKTATLPATPNDGDVITFSDVIGDLSSTNTLTINPNGKNIDGSSSNFVLTTARTTISLRYNGTEWNVVYRVPSVDVQTFTSDGTWVKPSGASRVRVMCIGGGGGGGGGEGRSSGSYRVGGGGGGGGGMSTDEIVPSVLASTVSVYVGAGGTGGAGGTLDNGADGNNGGMSSFGSNSISSSTCYVAAPGGNGGQGGDGTGTGGAGGAGGAGHGVGSNGSYGACNTDSPTAATSGIDTYSAASGGGGGGGVDSTNTLRASSAAGYAPGTGGRGGNGGDGSTSTTGSNGTGAATGGGGGGGGGGTSTGGNGGDGASGVVIVTTHF